MNAFPLFRLSLLGGNLWRVKSEFGNLFRLRMRTLNKGTGPFHFTAQIKFWTAQHTLQALTLERAKGIVANQGAMFFGEIKRANYEFAKDR